MFLKILDDLPPHYKNLIAISYDLLIALIAFPLALIVRLDSISIFSYNIEKLAILLIVIFGLKLMSVFLYKAHKGMWRFASINDLTLIIKTVSTATLLSILGVFFLTRLEGIPRSAFLIDWGLTIFLMSSPRFVFRVWKERRGASTGVKTLIIGAGRSGEQLIRDIKRTENAKMRIVGFLDDASTKQGRTLHGVSVIGNINSLAESINKTGAEQLIVAIPSASPRIISKILKDANTSGLKTLVSPGINDIVGGKVQVSQLRPIKIEDLLGRDPVKLDQSSITDMLNNKVVMITGGGGSIGSELCNQIIKFGPKKLIIFEMCEFFIYKTHMELSEKYPEAEIIPIVGDVRDLERVESVIKKFSPDIIFHAAAYKHVPMMELNPNEAIKTNVFGTKNVAKSASKFGVDKFVLVSTDKAVNPTNVMGSTKRIAEQICQSVSENSRTKFAIVRFGNVLGSAGSVVPRFWKQIEKGGPITVTHPDITRYFMSIPEACQLVLQTGALSRGGEIFVLDMGEPIKIVHLAQGMIRLSGMTEDDIEIKFTGLRPGEKLYEELLADKESTIPTPHEMIRIAKATKPDSSFISQVERIEPCENIREIIKKLVPEYAPAD